MLTRIEHVGSKSFAFAVRRLLDPALLREAQRVKLGSAYFWLAAADATETRRRFRCGGASSPQPILSSSAPSFTPTSQMISLPSIMLSRLSV